MLTISSDVPLQSMTKIPYMLEEWKYLSEKMLIFAIHRWKTGVWIPTISTQKKHTYKKMDTSNGWEGILGVRPRCSIHVVFYWAITQKQSIYEYRLLVLDKYKISVQKSYILGKIQLPISSQNLFPKDDEFLPIVDWLI